MSGFGDRLTEAREEAGLNQSELATRVGLSPQAIQAIEDPQRDIRSSRKAHKMAEVLGVRTEWLVDGIGPKRDAAPVQKGLAEGPPPPFTGRAEEALQVEAILAGEFVPPNSDHKIPVLAAARGGHEQEMFLQDGPIDFVNRPQNLEGIREAYAMEVTGESMVPRFWPQQIIHVDPFRRPSPRKGVVIWKHNRAVLLKEYVRRTGTHLIVREYQPEPREFSIPLEEVKAVHRVVGLQDD